MSFTVTIKATSITVYPGEESIEFLQPLINLLQYEDEYNETINALGYLLDKDTNTLYLHRGVDIEYLRRLLVDVEFVQDPYDEFDEMKFEYEEIYPPRNEEQISVIDFVAGSGSYSRNINERQLFLVKDAGFGKTFCTSVGVCKFKVKAMIIMHRDSLRNQWMKSLYNMIGLRDNDVHEITSSDELYQIAHNKHNFDYDIYLMTHATFRAGLKKIGNIKDASNISKNLKIGFKIIDEAHLEFRSTLMIDFTFNVCRNLYLTATDGRSSKDENSIFKHVFSNAEYYKKNQLSNTGMPSKWVEYCMVEINTHCKPNIYRFKVNGKRGMNPASYGKWVIQYDKNKSHFKVCKELLRMIYERDGNAKVLIFMPLIDLCQELAHYCIMELNYDETFEYDLNIKTINSHNTKMENERNKRADVIVTTIGSAGTGTDIPGISAVICCSPFYSRITAIQVFGRLRYCGKTCYYYDVWDSSVQMDKIWIKGRLKTLKDKALKIDSISWNEDNNDDK